MSQIEPEQPQKEELPHSVYGVVSLNLALCAIVLPFIYIAVCIGFGLVPPMTRVIFALHLICMVSFGTAALILGIVGVCQPRTRKVFSVLGIIFSSPLIMLVFILTVFAMINGIIARVL